MKLFVLTLLLIVALVLLTAYICFRIVFYVPQKNKIPSSEYPVPEGKVYEPFYDKMIHWIKEIRQMPHEDVSITSFDGLTLRGKYYEYEPDAPIELMFHGYRGTATRDLCGGVQRCFSLGHSALIVNQRASEGSDGQIISFGINESRDCHSWVDFMVEHFGPDVKIILCGISMGASTVLTAASEPLPPNVIGVLADCGFTSAKEIICHVAKRMHLPAGLLYPFVKLGAKIFGKFSLEEKSAIDSMSRCNLPVIFFHGDADHFVPWEMSKANYEACTGRKQLVVIPKAAHGLSYLVESDLYINEVKKFFG